MKDFLKNVAADRFVGGERPGVHRALGAAIVVGSSAGVLTYRLLRR